MLVFSYFLRPTIDQVLDALMRLLESRYGTISGEEMEFMKGFDL